jgi:hypothetical protein
MIHTSLFVDDTAIFVTPNKNDINFLDSTHQFGEVTGLVTNFAKIQVASIRCAGIDLHNILQVFQATHTSFPMKYLGIPL